MNKREKAVIGGAVGAVGVALVVMLTAAGSHDAPLTQQEKLDKALADSRASQAAERAAHPKIRYQVTGDTDQASITYQTPTGSEQANDIDVPLHTKTGDKDYLEVTFNAGDFVYLAAQNSNDHGTVTCRITNDVGDVISENSATGAYAIATCKGSAR